MKKQTNVKAETEILEEFETFVEDWVPDPQHDDWLDFTERWKGERRRKRQAVSVNALVRALSRANDDRDDWDNLFAWAWRLLYPTGRKLALGEISQ